MKLPARKVVVVDLKENEQGDLGENEQRKRRYLKQDEGETRSRCK
jgi:hypothetical protein